MIHTILAAVGICLAQTALGTEAFSVQRNDHWQQWRGPLLIPRKVMQQCLAFSPGKPRAGAARRYWRTVNVCALDPSAR